MPGDAPLKVENDEHYLTLRALMMKYIVKFQKQGRTHHPLKGLFSNTQSKQLAAQLMSVQYMRRGIKVPPLLRLTAKQGFGGIQVPAGLNGVRPLQPLKPYDYEKKPVSMGMVLAVPESSSQSMIQPAIQHNVRFLGAEWSRHIDTRMATDLQHLEVEHAAGRLDTQGRIRLKQLKLSTFQHNLRVSVLNARDDPTPNYILNGVLKKKRDREKKAREGFCKEVTKHHKTFTKFYEERKKKYNKDILAKLMKWHADKKKREENDEGKQERERIRALKEHDEEAYLELLKKTKNERILNLIKETDAFMNKLGAKVLQERVGGEEVVEEAQMEVAAEADGGHAVVESMQKNRNKYYELTSGIVEKVEQQPRMLKAGQMRSYQLKGLEWMVSLFNNQLNGILADEMGLGKTLQTISLISYLMENRSIMGPYLCIVPLSTLHNNWAAEFKRWAPDIDILVYEGNKEKRKALRKSRLASQNFNVLITTYENAMYDRTYLKPITWEYIIVDEAHRLKNPKSRLAEDLSKHYSSKRRLALTGTPLQNNLEEVWALLTFLHPAIFGSMTNFEQWFAAPFSKTGDKVDTNEEEKLLIIDRLHKVLRPFLLRREKSQVEQEMPDKKEYVVKCQMSALQKSLYRMVEDYRTNPFQAGGLHNATMQLRKIANHPFLMMDSYHLNRIVWTSGKVELLDRILPKLRKAGHRVLMFSQMTEMITILCEYFDQCDFKYLRLDGNTDTEARTRAVNSFNDPNSDYFMFILSTKAGGMGLNLQTADTVILFDSDWNPQGDEQAKARAHRIGQKKEVIVLRLLTEGTVEEKMYETARAKLENEAMVIQAGMFHEGHDADERRQMTMKLINEGQDEEMEVDETQLTELNSRLARNEQERELYNQMDRDAIGTTMTAIQWLDSRMIQEAELYNYPQLAAAKEKHEQDAVTALTGGPELGTRRKRGRSTSASVTEENMTEEEWLKKMNLILPGAPPAERGELDRAPGSAAKRPKREGRSSKKKQEEEYQDEELPDENFFDNSDFDDEDLAMFL